MALYSRLRPLLALCFLVWIGPVCFPTLPDLWVEFVRSCPDWNDVPPIFATHGSSSSAMKWNSSSTWSRMLAAANFYLSFLPRCTITKPLIISEAFLKKIWNLKEQNFVKWGKEREIIKMGEIIFSWQKSSIVVLFTYFFIYRVDHMFPPDKNYQIPWNVCSSSKNFFWWNVIMVVVYYITDLFRVKE